MKILQYYADWMWQCPKCGSIEFNELWSGDDEFAYLIEIICKHCGQSYPTKERFMREHGKTNPVAQWLIRVNKFNIPF